MTEVFVDMDGLSGPGGNVPEGKLPEPRIFELSGRSVEERIFKDWESHGVHKLVLCFEPFNYTLKEFFVNGESKVVQSCLVHINFRDEELEQARKSVSQKFKEHYKDILTRGT